MAKKASPRTLSRTTSPKDWLLAAGDHALAIDNVDERIARLSFLIREFCARRMRKQALKLLNAIDSAIADDPGAVRWCRRFICDAYNATGKRDAAFALFREQLEKIKSNQKLKGEERKEAMDDWRRDALHLHLEELVENLSPKERGEIEYGSSVRRANEAIATRDFAAACKALADAEAAAALAGGIDRFGMHLIDLYAAANDRASVTRLLRALKSDDRDVATAGNALMKVGMAEQAVKLARDDIRRAIAEADAMRICDHHASATTIAAVLAFLSKHQMRDEARKQLDLALKHAAAWKISNAWVRSVVYSTLAVPLAKLKDPAAGRAMLTKSIDAISRDKSNFSTSAWASILNAYADIAAWDEALALGKKNSRNEHGRRIYASLLARAGRIDDLHKLLASVKSPLESSELAWTVATALEREAAAAPSA